MWKHCVCGRSEKRHSRRASKRNQKEGDSFKETTCEIVVVYTKWQQSAAKEHILLLQQKGIIGHPIQCKEKTVLASSHITKFSRLDLIVDETLYDILIEDGQLCNGVHKAFKEMERCGKSIYVINKLRPGNDVIGDLLHKLPANAKIYLYEKNEQVVPDGNINDTTAMKGGTAFSSNVAGTTHAEGNVHIGHTYIFQDLYGATRDGSAVLIKKIESLIKEETRSTESNKILVIVEFPKEMKDTIITDIVPNLSKSDGVQRVEVKFGSIIISLTLVDEFIVTEEWINSILRTLFSGQLASCISQGQTFSVTMQRCVTFEGTEVPSLCGMYETSLLHTNCITRKELHTHTEVLKSQIAELEEEVEGMHLTARLSDDACCKKCGDLISKCSVLQEKSVEITPMCPECNDVCLNCREKHKSNPERKPPRDGIDSKEIRIVVIGKEGAGKSATANTILKEETFQSKMSMKSVTEKCQYERIVRWDHKIMIVDTPGMFYTNKLQANISTEIKKCITISAPGPHAFLLVISLSERFTKGDKESLKNLDEIFGANMMKYLIVVFTGRDRIEDYSLKDYLEESPDELKSVLNAAGGGYLTFNNTGNEVEKEKDAQTCFDRMKKMVKKNGGSHYTSKMFEEAEDIMQERITRELEVKKEDLRQEFVQELQEEMEEVMRQKRDCFQTFHETYAEQMEWTLRELVHEEMEKTEKQKKLSVRIPKSKGSERVKMQHQLDDVEIEIKQIIAKRKTVEEEIILAKLSNAIILKSQEIREEERENVKKEEKITLSRFIDGIKHFGPRFMNLLK